MTPLHDTLQRLGACGEAIAWVGDRDLPTAWRECPRGDWMLWLAAHAGVDCRIIVLAACDCAELAQEHWSPETAPACGTALTTVRAWARGEATLGEVRQAVWAAKAAAAAAADAAWASRAAAWAAAAAADAAWASRAAKAAAEAASAALAASAAGAETSARAAELVRARITAEDVGRALGVES